ncbi:hypothetical protein BDR06DRAFT_1041216 [Suillus hirtellus]|nr:hypothetical protein BDR06DRAFT_1041216 [Suillus hirtellus]
MVYWHGRMTGLEGTSALWIGVYFDLFFFWSSKIAASCSARSTCCRSTSASISCLCSASSSSSLFAHQILSALFWMRQRLASRSAACWLSIASLMSCARASACSGDRKSGMTA